jgi:hypothetical protein
VVTGEATAEEAAIAALAAIRAFEEDVVKHPLVEASSPGTVGCTASTKGAKGRLITNDGFFHRRVLRGEGYSTTFKGKSQRLNV